jgi:hypothetical protein
VEFNEKFKNDCEFKHFDGHILNIFQ